MKEYPQVIGEFETLDLILQGHSIARYGDGEFNIVQGRNCVSQKGDTKLQHELKSILMNKNPRLLVGIPTMDPKGVKYDRWGKYAPKYKQFLKEGKRYYSSFITRPDSAQWCFDTKYWDKLKQIWTGKDITLVRGSNRSLHPELLSEAKSIYEVSTPYSDAYVEIDRIEKDIYRALPEAGPVILCCGATATVLASRLCGKGYHAIDLGHVGMFINKEGKKETTND